MEYMYQNTIDTFKMLFVIRFISGIHLHNYRPICGLHQKPTDMSGVLSI